MQALPDQRRTNTTRQTTSQSRRPDPVRVVARLAMAGLVLALVGASPILANAVYDSGLGAPTCMQSTSVCDSCTLLERSGHMYYPESNQPNTADGCSDGQGNQYHLVDESIERIVVRSLDGQRMITGDTVLIEVTFFPYASGSGDLLQIEYENPDGTYKIVDTFQPTQGGLQKHTAGLALSGETLHRVRARLSDQSDITTCDGNGYYDVDELVFEVASSRQVRNPPAGCPNVYEIDHWSRGLIMAHLTALSGETGALTDSQTFELDRIRDDYFFECQKNAQFTNVDELFDVYKEQLVFFHLENTYNQYLPRINGSDNRSQWEAHWHDSRDLVLVSPDLLPWDAYVAQAERLASNLHREFRIHARNEACADWNCSETPDAGDIHQALSWSFLAYQTESFARARLVNGLIRDDVYSRSEVLYYRDLNAELLPVPLNYLAPHKSRAMVAVLDLPTSDKKDLLIDFRGTNPLSEDPFTDANLMLAPHDEFDDDAIKVHHGFRGMWRAHRSSILSTLDSYLSQGNQIDNIRTIYVTGHSLGAAVATVALPRIARHLEENYGLKDTHRLKMINFGSPRTGNAAWVGAFRERRSNYSYARVWNTEDIVAAVPLEWMGYRHIDASIELPELPGQWPASALSKFYQASDYHGLIERVIDGLKSLAGLEGKKVVDHTGQAYQFNVVRNLLNLPVTPYTGGASAASSHDPGICVGYANNFGRPRLYETLCDASFHFACEKIDQISVLDEPVGPRALTWNSTWIKSNAKSAFSNSYAACPASYDFSAPSRPEDLQAIDSLLIDGHESIWVDQHRPWM